ncbi:hypothetical protein DFH07DRAFT_552195 [Mycena maculata]|uniref:Uncharacterized protein n=1 Tax=Mycena maculata TaxID=230809 RepID=A0AAD7ISY5_9AGAR|nr:hypothetical protein DFH07DRAFT_552195 [Mycena maculata]
MTTTAGAWQPPVPASAPTPPPTVAPFAPGYTYGHLAHLRLPSFENAATGKSTAPYTNKSPSDEAPRFVLSDPTLISDLETWFEVMMSSTPPAHAPYPGPLRSWPTPPACAHCWDAIETHAMVTCRNEGWVESYATNIISLVSCLIQGIWPTRRLVEWPVTLLHSQQGDRHITVAQRRQTTNGVRLSCHSAIAGEWKTQTVVATHFDPFPDDHILPRREAENEDAILKKLGLHIVTANEQCQRHNNDLALPNIPVHVVNAHYGIVFTGASCVVAQLVLGPTPPNYKPFDGLAIAGVFIARNHPTARSLIGIMLGMIWAHENIRIKRDLTGTQGRVDRIYDRYLTMYDSLVVTYGLKRRDGAPGMPYPPPGPPGPPGGLPGPPRGPPGPPRGPPGPPGGGNGRYNNPGPFSGSFPSGSGGGGMSGGMGRPYQTSNRQYSAPGPGYHSLQHREQMLLRHVLVWAGSRSVHLDGVLESRANLVRIDLSLLLASPTVPDGPLDLKIIKSVPIVGCLLTFPNARTDHVGDFKTPATSEFGFAPNFRIVKYSFVIEGASFAPLAGIISTLCIAFHTEISSSAALILDVGDSSGSNSAHRYFGEDSPGNFGNGNTLSSMVRRTRCLCVVDFSQGTLRCRIF